MLSAKETQSTKDMETRGVFYLGCYTGLEIKEVDEEKTTFIDPAGKAHRVKTYADSERPYFKWNNNRIHLDECFRV